MFECVDSTVTLRAWSELIFVLEVADARVTKFKDVGKKFTRCFAFSLTNYIDILVSSNEIVCGIQIGMIEGWYSRIVFLIVVFDEMVLDEKCEASSNVVGVDTDELGERRY